MKLRTFYLSLFFSIVSSTRRLRIKPHSLAVYDIEFMAKCVMGHSGWIYNGYGCYCGIGGAGKPMDGIDECCRKHDICYDIAALKGGPCWVAPFEYFAPYEWRCQDQKIQCTGKMNKNWRMLPLDCGDALCECDRKLTECWSRFPQPQGHIKCSF
ncbi:unnamed protein product [Caenorhabditis auriculariae]|uniref:Phospholipase A2 n=1 Tax=Caenorhabditis auriculariae TaxID=2777116 RepID=A0A8S1H961_9PELO|nr:unnamed protein product [Caenorhabditis auriculariae]